MFLHLLDWIHVIVSVPFILNQGYAFKFCTSKESLDKLWRACSFYEITDCHMCVFRLKFLVNFEVRVVVRSLRKYRKKSTASCNLFDICNGVDTVKQQTCMLNKQKLFLRM